MKSEVFAGFDSFVLSGQAKRKILEAIENESPNSRHPINYRRLTAVAASVFIVLAIGAVVAYQLAFSKPDVIYKNGYKIYNRLPTVSSVGGTAQHSRADRQIPKEVYASAEGIIYGTVTGFQWAEPDQPGFSGSLNTIVMVKISSVYKGDLKQATTVNLLLPFEISGTGDGIWVEDSENACSLKKGSEAFFLVEKSTNSLCSFQVDWGDEHIILNKNGKFKYMFGDSQEFTFGKMEEIIQKNLK